MESAPSDNLSQRVLILAPTGRDGTLTKQILAAARIPSDVCTDLEETCRAIERGAGALVLTEEALRPSSQGRLESVLARQAPWSDLPILLCTYGGERSGESSTQIKALESSGNVAVMERPIRTRTLLSAVKAAVRARRRQYEVRDLMVRLRDGIRERELVNASLAKMAIDNGRLFAAAQRERARVEEANRAKDEFLAMVSHELRTPLNAMLGWTHMLRTGKLDSARRAKALEVIERNAKAQTQLIEDLLDVSRIVTGKLRLNVISIDLSQVVAAALDSVRPAAEAKGVALDVVLDPRAVPISGDPDRLQQVVWNLVANAVKFTPAGGRVEIRLEGSDERVEITVRDTGKGIDPSLLPHVFDRFWQAEAGTERTHGGLGLGLAIGRHLVELHGGTIHANSAGEAAGSTFVVRLPTRSGRTYATPLPSLLALSASSSLALDRKPELSGLRVLVVDDEPDVRELLRAVLEPCKVSVMTAASTADALAILGHGSPDVLISDIGMPGEDGYRLMQRVREQPPDRGGSIPALALTAYARREDRTRALLAGFNMHLSKPIEPTELIDVLANLTGRQAVPSS